MTSQGGLLTQRRFVPYFITQALGAFNDNVYKNVLLILVAFAGSNAIGMSSDLFINLAAGLFILPFFLFSAFAGELADKFEKSRFIRVVKLVENRDYVAGSDRLCLSKLSGAVGTAVFDGHPICIFRPG